MINEIQNDFNRGVLNPNFGKNYCLKIVCGAGNHSVENGVNKYEVFKHMIKLKKNCWFLEDEGSIYVLCID